MHYALKIHAGEKIDLKDIKTDEHGGLDRPVAEATTEGLGSELAELQDLLYSAGQNALLIVLQGRDTSGKDGTIRCLARYMNMQSCHVASFKVPTEEELAHDFLWRIHREVPRHGQSVVFNRSHYEDVIVVRVHGLISKDECKDRYAHINQFEKLLADSNTIILKFFLHISKKEQEARLLDREKQAKKAWKLSAGDWVERDLWADYTKAFEDAISHCSTKSAPWYIVPADHKWFRNLAVVETLVETLKPFRKEWLEHLSEIGKKAEVELKAYRAKKH